MLANDSSQNGRPFTFSFPTNFTVPTGVLPVIATLQNIILHSFILYYDVYNTGHRSTTGRII